MYIQHILYVNICIYVYGIGIIHMPRPIRYT